MLKYQAIRTLFFVSLSLMLTVLILPAAGADSLLSTLQEEPPQSLIEAAQTEGRVAQGAVLFADQVLACASCHAQGATDQVGPDLTRLPPETTDLALAESLLWPSKTIREGFEQSQVITDEGKTFLGRVVAEDDQQIELRPAATPQQTVTLLRDEVIHAAPMTLSAMPENLVDQLENRQQFLDLLRYVMHLRDRPAAVQRSEQQVMQLPASHPRSGALAAVRLPGLPCQQRGRRSFPGPRQRRT